MTGAALRMAWPHSFMAVKKPQKKHWHEAASSALNFPCLKEVSRNCLFVFDVVNFKNGGSLAEYRRFGAVNFHFLKKSRRLASFWSCQPSLLKEVSQNGFLSDKKIDGWMEKAIEIEKEIEKEMEIGIEREKNSDRDGDKYGDKERDRERER